MNEIWLEDLVALSESLNFSKAAQQRNVTQPAFGRRIKALEAWCGATLVDRTSHRLTLTEAGETTLIAARDILQRTLMLKRDLSALEAGKDRLVFASTQALAFSFFPEWVKRISSSTAASSIQLLAENMRACEQIMETGRAQFLLCHAHVATGAMLPQARFRHVQLARDRLLPIIAPTVGTAGGCDPGGPFDGHRPFLAYDAGSGLGRILQVALGRKMSDAALKPVFTSQVAMVLKSMAVEGKGLAWVPESLVRDELRSGALVLAGDDSWMVELEIVLVRPNARLSPLGEAVWKTVSSSP